MFTVQRTVNLKIIKEEEEVEKKLDKWKILIYDRHRHNWYEKEKLIMIRME